MIYGRGCSCEGNDSASRDKAPTVSWWEYLGQQALYYSSNAAHSMNYEYPSILATAYEYNLNWNLLKL